LRPKTIRLYRYLLRSHIAPYFEGVTVAEVTLARVRRWRRKLLDPGTSEVTTAKAYRLLRAIFNTALDDGLIRRNPCRIKGAAEGLRLSAALRSVELVEWALRGK
jgi:hypothetical protein